MLFFNVDFKVKLSQVMNENPNTIQPGAKNIFLMPCNLMEDNRYDSGCVI